ncbi:MAG TPA: VOC family protein, partial [Blastocatellia bacterium]
GEHAGGLTHNALIPFQDGSYLELIAFRSAETAANPASLQPVPELWRRFEHRRALGEGLVDFALASRSLEAEILRLNERGLDFTGPSAGGRLRPDGRELRWLTAIPRSFDLPFLIEDLTPRSLRVPGGPTAHHENGALGIAEVTVITNDLQSSIRRYDLLFGAKRLAPSALEPDRGLKYSAGNASVSLAGPNPADLGGPEAVDRPNSIELFAIESKGLLTGPATHWATIALRAKD